VGSGWTRLPQARIQLQMISWKVAAFCASLPSCFHRGAYPSVQRKGEHGLYLIGDRTGATKSKDLPSTSLGTWKVGGHSRSLGTPERCAHPFGHLSSKGVNRTGSRGGALYAGRGQAALQVAVGGSQGRLVAGISLEPHTKRCELRRAEWGSLLLFSLLLKLGSVFVTDSSIS
jgi:hypothetical protein